MKDEHVDLLIMPWVCEAHVFQSMLYSALSQLFRDMSQRKTSKPKPTSEAHKQKQSK